MTRAPLGPVGGNGDVGNVADDVYGDGDGDGDVGDVGDVEVVQGGALRQEDLYCCRS